MDSAATITLDELTVIGSSRAGVETWFRIRPPDAAFDVGRGSPRLAGVDRIFLTHGHLDHAAGLPFVLSQRSLLGLGATTVYCPSAIVTELGDYIRSAAALEGRTYDFRLVGLGTGQRVDVGSGLEVEAFATHHVVPSLGYHLIRTVERLRDELAHRSGEDIAALRRAGRPVTTREERIWLSYPGDTAATILDGEPRLTTAEVLLLECTFLGEGRRESASSYGHIHLEDLVKRQSDFNNQRIILHHLSRRFSLTALRRAVEELLPNLAQRIVILGEVGDIDD